MSDEFEMANAMKQLAAVNAAAVAQRQNEVAQEQAKAAGRDKERKSEADEATKFHYKVNALKFAASLSQSRVDGTAERVIADADKFLVWLRTAGENA